MVNWLKNNRVLARETRMTWATRVTLLRFCLVPVITWALWFSCWRLAGLAFVAAAGTDFLDGYLARSLNEKTVLGAVLDTIADKVLLGYVLITMLVVPMPLSVPLWVLWLLLCKEVVVVVGAVTVAWYCGVGVIVPPLVAKMSMAFEMGLVGWSLLAVGYGWLVPQVVVQSVVMVMLASCMVYGYHVMKLYYGGVYD